MGSHRIQERGLIMSDVYYETFYWNIILIFWIIIPAIFGVVMFLYFCRLSNAYKAHEKFVEDRKYQIEWGYTLTGKPFVKKQGWGTNYSPLSKEQYFAELLNKRKNEINASNM